MLRAAVARTVPDRAHHNTLAVLPVRLRFQIAPGTGSGLGIAGLTYEIRIDDHLVFRGTTSADGEALIPYGPLTLGPVILRMMDTDYQIQLYPALQLITNFAGLRKRLETLGYLTGYLTLPLQGQPDVDEDSVETQQAILNLQADQGQTIDGDVGRQTRDRLHQQVGGI